MNIMTILIISVVLLAIAAIGGALLIKKIFSNSKRK